MIICFPKLSIWIIYFDDSCLHTIWCCYHNHCKSETWFVINMIQLKLGVYIYIEFPSIMAMEHLASMKVTNIAPENGCLEDEGSPFWMAYFQGAFAVSLRECSCISWTPIDRHGWCFRNVYFFGAEDSPKIPITVYHLHFNIDCSSFVVIPNSILYELGMCIFQMSCFKLMQISANSERNYLFRRYKKIVHIYTFSTYICTKNIQTDRQK